jgi:transposase InsO family protein
VADLTLDKQILQEVVRKKRVYRLYCLEGLQLRMKVKRRSASPDYTRPGKPMDNGLIESFNGRLRDEFLNANEFITMHDLRTKLGSWQEDYNHHRPHGSLGSGPPSGPFWLRHRTD